MLNVKGFATALLVFASTAPGAAPAAWADETRGCDAQYELIYLLIDDGKPTSVTKLSFGRFTSRGLCRSRAYANDCRREARSLAHSCMQAHWTERWEREKPGACYRQRANMGPQDYRLEDLKRAIEYTVCCSRSARSFREEVRVRVVGRIWGDTRCAGETVLADSYVVTPQMCEQVADKACGGE